MRAEEISKIQVALENELVRAKLGAYGLTEEEVSQKPDGMTNQQVHLLAQASDDIMAGGDGVGLATGVLLISLADLILFNLHIPRDLKKLEGSK